MRDTRMLVVADGHFGVAALAALVTAGYDVVRLIFRGFVPQQATDQFHAKL
jgi:16S rRNA C1402 (ribose-2'-O) methylase RsmI